MAESLVKKAATGIIWSAVDRFSAQALAFVFNLLIARLLLPSDYGVIAMLEVFMSISIAFIDSGFANALIRKPDRTEEDINTVFYFNILISFIAYAVLWLAAPLIADFYEMPLLRSITRWVSLKLVFNAFGSIQGVLLSIRMDFKSRAKIRLVLSSVVGLFSLFLAYRGLGVWVLVAQQLVDSLLGAVALWAIVRWKPHLVFSIKSFREMFSYGSRLLLTGLLGAVYGNLYSIVIGKLFTPADLGHYSKANSLSAFPNSNLSGVLMSVLFPALSSLQNDRARLIGYYKKTLVLATFITMPVALGMAAVARPLIVVLLTDKWVEMIPLFRILCVGTMWISVNSVNLNLLQVLGRSDYFLRLDIIKKVLMTIAIIVSAPFGILAMCFGQFVLSIIGLIINSYYTKRLIGYSFFDEMKDVLPQLILSLIMAVIAFLCTTINMDIKLQLIVAITVGASFYFSMAYFLKFEAISDLTIILKKIFSKGE